MSGTEDQPLAFLLHRLNTALRAEVSVTVLEPIGLSFPQYICMRSLSRYPGRSNAELARTMMVSPQAMNMVVRGLQDCGLVTRPAEVPSGRSRPAELTREGRMVLDRTIDGVRAAEERVLAPLSDAQRRQFRQLLAALGQ